MPLSVGHVVRHAGASLRADRLLRRARRRQLLVVCYHGLRADEASARHWLLLPTSAFEEQIAFVARHYDCLPVDEALERLRTGRLTRPTACITFDDGYANNLTLGLPVLRAHGVPATIYLATGLVGTDAWIWTVELEEAFVRASADQVDLAAIGLGRQPLGERAARAALARAAIERLKTRPAPERVAIAGGIVSALAPMPGARDHAAFGLLDADGIARLAASGLVTFGGHTVHHEIVSRLDDAALEAEVGGSIRAVRQLAPTAVSRSFAYPNGRPIDVDARAAAVLARHGCLGAFTTIEGLSSADTPPFMLRRLVVGGGDVALRPFAMRAAGV